ncbi:MAG: hydrogenase formation protein HypD, partial [Fibrobacterota bacterium]
MNDNFNDSFFCRRILQKITALASGSGPMRFMEVCGTHTVRIGEAGIRSLLPKNISLVSGPGCPVCVTPGSYIDNAVEAALREGFKIATFGDMIRVPGENWSLESARASGVKVEVVTSPYDVLNITGPVMFLAVGFETTAAPIAAAVSKAVESKRDDIFFYTSLKTVPPALKALQSMPDIGIDGFLLPGHV